MEINSSIQSFIKGSKFWAVFQNKVFRKMFSGRVITDIGDTLYYTASMWLVWELTKDPFYTGITGALIQAAGAMSFVTGPLIDKWKLRRILLGTQLINGLGVLIIPVAAMFDLLSVWLIIILMPLLQFINQILYPAQDAALPRIVDQEELPRANSLFRTTLRAVDAGANAIAGILISLIGAMSLFVINSGTFAIAFILFLGVSVSNTTQKNKGDEDNVQAGKSDKSPFSQYIKNLKEGISYVRETVLLSMMAGLTVANMGIVAALAIMPAFADTFGGPATYGLLMGANGAGVLIGTVGSFLFEDYSLSLVTIFGFCLSGLLWIGAIAIPGVWPTTVLFLLAMVPFGVFDVLLVSTFQAGVEEDLLGRVMALLRTFSSAMMPLGALLGGVIASEYGVTIIMYGAGVSMIGLGLYYLIHPELRNLPPAAEANIEISSKRTSDKSIKKVDESTPEIEQ